MKKILLMSFTLAVGIFNAQVGINTETPKGTLHISENSGWVETKAQGVNFPKFTTKARSKFTDNLEEGMMIYNTDKKCIEMYVGFKNGVHQWACLSGVESSNANINNKVHYVLSTLYQPNSVQGVINNSTNKVTIQIPYTNGSGSYSAVNKTVMSTEGQDGDVNNLTLKIPAGNFSAQSHLTATIEVGGDGVYEVKKMSLGQSYTIATYNLNIDENQFNVELKGIGGIPDKKFGVKTNGELEHQFVYVSVEGPDGRTWLNNNLGAEYAKLGSPYFNPQKQGDNHLDWKSFGSLFQWGRDSDGHELVKWNSSEVRTQKHNMTWYSNFDNRLNYTVDKDPCPAGYRLPTLDELDQLHQIITGAGPYSNIVSNKMWEDKILSLPASGLRKGQYGSAFNLIGLGEIWSSTPKAREYARGMNFSINRSNINFHSGRSNGKGVRCIKNKN